MKVSFVRKGGWATPFNLHSPPAVLNADKLLQAEREELDRLVRAAFAIRDQGDAVGREAAGSYTITVEDNGRQQTLSVADAEEEKRPAAADLREWIETRLPRQ